MKRVGQRAPGLSREQERMFHLAVLEGAGMGITVQDRAGRIVYANATAARLTGYPSAAAMCSTPTAETLARFDMFDEAGDPLAVDRLPGRLALDGQATDELLVCFRPRGAAPLSGDRWSMVRAVPLRDAAGEVTHAINFFREVTEPLQGERQRRFLLRADAELGSSLDYEKTLSTVARLAVPLLADWCAVDLADESRAQGTRRVAVAHVDPAKMRLVEEIERLYPSDPDAPRGLPNVLRTGKPEMMASIPRELFLQAAIDEQHLRLIDRLELRSYVCAPLHVRGRTIGAITFAMAESGRTYAAKDLEFAQALADRAALAIDNARLYREAERGRAGAEETFRLLVQSVRDYAIFKLSPSGVVTTWNTGAALIYGYREDEIVGQPFSRFYPDEAVRSGRCDRELAIAAREGRFEDEGSRVRRDGGRFFANVVLTAIRDERGGLQGFAKVTRDLTERKRAEEELRAEMSRRLAAEQTSRFAQLFMGVLGHDLRNPLAAIVTGAGYLGRLATSEKQSRAVSRITASADRMARMIEQLLDFTRLGIGGGIRLDPRPASLADLCKNVVEELALSHPERPIRCRYAADTEGAWDTDRVEQALSNLLGNALQHGAHEAPVSLAVEDRGHELEIAIENGGAIDPDLLPHLFAPFKGHRGRNSTGLGLGLYISHQIVRAHGGDIEVRSSGEQGTRFTIRLPRQAAAASASAQ